jgi:hypothetical protein
LHLTGTIEKNPIGYVFVFLEFVALKPRVGCYTMFFAEAG